MDKIEGTKVEGGKLRTGRSNESLKPGEIEVITKIVTEGVKAIIAGRFDETTPDGSLLIGVVDETLRIDRINNYLKESDGE